MQLLSRSIACLAGWLAGWLAGRLARGAVGAGGVNMSGPVVVVVGVVVVGPLNVTNCCRGASSLDIVLDGVFALQRQIAGLDH